MISDFEYKEGGHMDTRAEDRFRQVLQTAAGDPEYRALQSRCAGLDQHFLAALEKLPEEDRRVVLDYIRALGESALRLTEIACEHMK